MTEERTPFQHETPMADDPPPATTAFDEFVGIAQMALDSDADAKRLTRIFLLGMRGAGALVAAEASRRIGTDNDGTPRMQPCDVFSAINAAIDVITKGDAHG